MTTLSWRPPKNGLHQDADEHEACDQVLHGGKAAVPDPVGKVPASMYTRWRQKARKGFEARSRNGLGGIKNIDFRMCGLSSHCPLTFDARLSTLDYRPPMRSLHTLGITLLVATIFVGGCIAAVRKGVGTLQGPRGSMTVTADNGGFAQGETIGSVDADSETVPAFQGGTSNSSRPDVRQALEGHDLYSRGTGDLELSFNITR